MKESTKKKIMGKLYLANLIALFSLVPILILALLFLLDVIFILYF